MKIEMKVFRVAGICYLDFYLVKEEAEEPSRSEYIIEFKVNKRKVILEKCLNTQYLQYCEEKAKEFVKEHKGFI